MIFESPNDRVMDHPTIQVSDFAFEIFMSLELSFKILADGLFFSPKSYIKDVTAVLDVFIYVCRIDLHYLMDAQKYTNQFGAQLLMYLCCIRH